MIKVDLDKVDSKLFDTLLGEQFAFNMQMYVSGHFRPYCVPYI